MPRRCTGGEFIMRKIISKGLLISMSKAEFLLGLKEIFVEVIDQKNIILEQIDPNIIKRK
jgi:hypothetical protein